MNNYNKIIILNLNEIDKFDTKKKGEYLFLNGHYFNLDYSINLKDIIKNFNYIIVFNQTTEFIKNFVYKSINIYNMPAIENVLHVKENKVIKINSWGFKCTENSNDFIKNNYETPNDKSNKLSFILNKKFIFPLFPVKLIQKCMLNNPPYYQNATWHNTLI